MVPPGWRIGIDIGGTFTDIVAVHRGLRAVRGAKVRSRPHDELVSLQAALGAVGLSWDDVAMFVHGTTLVTNAIIEDRLSEVALVATKGFRDVIAIGRQNRLHLYRLDAPPKPTCLVPDERRFEVRERISPDGTVLTPLDPEHASRVIAAIAATGVRSVAVSLLNAYASPAHELLLESRLRSIVPHVSLSHRINPEEREFERTSAAVLNASLMPLVADYLHRLRQAVPPSTGFHLFHSAGGMASAAMASERPLILAMSGPAAGVAASCRVATALGLDHVIAFDMGGTTTDVCLVTQGLPELRFGATLAGRQFRQPMVAVESIGAGGGSIARVEQGMLKVGPQSAGAVPGPGCYGLGGTEPTVTDANVVLGYLDSRHPLADGIRVDRSFAEEAVGRLASEMGLRLMETALGIVRVANANMVRAMRNITLERGVDGRRCVLLAYGGAGPVHAAALAREFGIAKVLVPAASSVFSALGCATAVPSYTRQRTVRIPSRRWNSDRLASIREELVTDIIIDLGLAERARTRLQIEDVALVRFVGQSYSVEVPYAVPPDADAIGRKFCDEHRRLYGFAGVEPWEIEAIRVRVSSPDEATMGELNSGQTNIASEEEPLLCWFAPDKPTAAIRRLRASLTPFEQVPGPAIVADECSTIVVPPGWTITADPDGNLTIAVKDSQ